MFKSTILILKPDKFLFVLSEKIDFLLKVADDDIFLVCFHLEGRVEIG
jgi:hypothetical protein